MKKLRKFIPLEKAEEQKDGTLLVTGLVTAEKPDQEGEVCHYKTTKPFYQQLNEKFSKATSAVKGMELSIAPLREMHQLKAAGCGKTIEFNDDSKEIRMGFHVVDAEACTKVRNGVYIGFSQGGAYVKTWKENGLNYYTADPAEVSLVDSPCLEQALIDSLAEKTFTYVKADGANELRKYSLKKSDTEKNLATRLKEKGVTLEDISKASNYVCQVQIGSKPLEKGLWTVSETARVLATLAYIQQDSACEAQFEGDESEVPGKLLTILSSLVEAFVAMATEEANELLAATRGKGEKAMTPEELKKAQEALEKAHKSAGEHLVAMHKMAQDHHDAMTKAHGDHLSAMHEAMGKCAKAIGVQVGEHSAAKTKKDGEFSKADIDAAVAKALAEKEKQPETFSKAQLDEAVAAALKKSADDKAEAEAAKAKLTLVPRPGDKTGKSAENVAPQDVDLKKSVGF